MKLTKLETLIIILIAVFGVGSFAISRALAEQNTGTPESGVNSVLKETYDNLVSSGYGLETGSNGIMWNRIISSANWVPDGTVTEGDVKNGKTFYDDSRTEKTGTLDYPLYADQSLQAKDFRDSNASSTWSSWSLTSGAATTGVYKDNRTGLYWSPKQTTSTNEFNLLACDFYSTTPRGDYNGTDTDCGNAINICGTLSLDANGDSIADTKWYLPTQSELMQAYLNGIYLSTNTTWTTGDNFWSSTETQSVNTYAWYTNLYYGNTNYSNKTATYSVRCVLRDL
jgi:hypothetical protein